MSFAAEKWAYDQLCGDGIAKSVLAYLAHLADRNTGEAWPAMDTIIAAVEHGERAVRKAVAKLVTIGKVEREQRFAANGRCTSTLYRLPVVSAPAEEPERAAAAEAAPDPAPTPANQQGTHPCQSAGVILEPSKNEPEEEDAREGALAPTPVEISAEPKPRPGRRTERGQAETPWPEDPGPEILAIARERGFKPEEGELLPEIAEWAHRTKATSADWPGVVRQWQPRCGGPSKPQARARASKPAKQDRILRTVSAFRAVWQQREARI